ncbi:MAG TPA: nucleoside deaminase [Symbiobacteriaceae bacterium]|nr:nucleoside deaminase [Symbiobacteriaceae bacterium]
MENDRRFLALALAQAEEAFRKGTYPVGAVLVGPDGEVLAAGHNLVFPENDMTAHAEVVVLRQAGNRLLRDKAYKHRCTLYTSCEPCLMCTGALMNADIARTVFATADDWLGALRAMKSGTFKAERFAKMEMVAAPFPDLDRRQRELLAAWDTGRNLPGDFWLPK